MPGASYNQTNFQGGQWSGFQQGRSDDKRYPIALARMLNAMPGEEGSNLRRSGFLYRMPTRYGQKAVLRSWRYSQTAAYLGEFTSRRLRFWSDGDVQSDTFVAVTDISTDTPAVLTITQAPDTWLSGDEVFLEFNDIPSMAYAPLLVTRNFRVVLTDEPTEVTLQDVITGDDIDGAAFSGSFTGARLRHILAVRTPYEEDELQDIRKVQSAQLNEDEGVAESKVIFLHGSHQPESLSSLDIFSDGLMLEEFLDGPYMDPPSDIVALTPSDTDGLITLTLAAGAATWLIGTTYAKGNIVHTVHDGTIGLYWISLHDANVGNNPGGVGGGIPMNTHWAMLPVTFSDALTYTIGEAVLSSGGLIGVPKIYYSLTDSNTGNEPTENPTLWSLTPPTWNDQTAYPGGPKWLLFNNALWVGTAGLGPGVGPPYAEPPAAPTLWYDGLTPTVVFDLFPNINAGRGFLPTDVGRAIRLLNGPAPWDVAHTYSTGNFATFIGNTYKALAGSTGVQPDLDPETWELQSVGPTWTWARIVYSNQPVTEEIDVWVAGSYDIGDIVGWGANDGDPVTNAYVSLIATNTNAPPTDPTILFAGGWVRVGEFADFDIVPQVVIETWSAEEVYDLGALVYLEGDTVLYVASQDGLDGDFEPGTDPEWVEINGVEATVIGDPGQIYATIEGDPLPDTTDIYLWRLGLYSDTTGWPTCGTYHEGRLCLAGPVPNRVDLSVSNEPFNFAPTTPDGTVADNNAFDKLFNFHDQNDIFWMASEETGLVCGTLAGEILIAASTLDDPLTPTSAQAREKTTYGCANTEPEHLPSSLAFVQARQRKIMEYIGDGSKYVGLNLTQPSKDVTESGTAEIVYQQESLPVLWGRNTNGLLFGISYKRDPQQEYAAAHEHVHGAPTDMERVFESLAVQVDVAGTAENLWAIMLDENDIYHVEMLVGTFEEDGDINEAMLLDSGVRPAGAKWIAGPGVDGSIVFYGLWPHITSPTAPTTFLGADMGALSLSAGATITVPVDGTTLTSELLISLITVVTGTTGGSNGIVIDFDGAPFEGDLPPIVEGQHYEMAAAVGFEYNSDGQMLRPLEGSVNGPTFAKTRRNHRFGFLLWRTNSISVGTDFASLRPVSLREADGKTPIANSGLFSGIVRGSVDDKYSFDGQICWRISGPMPAVILAVGGFFDVFDV